MSTEERADAEESKVETSAADFALRNAQNDLQAAYDKYYSLDLKGAQAEIPSSPTSSAFDGVDTYTVPEVNAHRGDLKTPQLKEGFFTVPVNRFIVEVTYECIGNYCGWCYNPDGGYAPSIRYSEGRTKATWRRLYDGKPVTEVYRVYWKSL